MKRSNQAATSVRSTIYYDLAEAIYCPDPMMPVRLLAAVIQGEQRMRSSACGQAVTALSRLPTRRTDALDQELDDLLIGHNQRPIPVHESLFRHGGLAGQLTWQLERRYQRAGLAPAMGILPDHACMELSYLGHLAAAEADAIAHSNQPIQKTAKAEQSAFLREHAGQWLPDLGQRLSDTGHPIFAVVGTLLRDFLQEELTHGSHTHADQVTRPTLVDPSRCTLCGICVDRCPHRALAIVDTHAHTSLRLSQPHCTGCNRCAKYCPEGVLQMQPAHSSLASDMLRISPRLTCHQCGRPTVSEAELVAVLQRLQPDPRLRMRFQLCVPCKTGSSLEAP